MAILYNKPKDNLGNSVSTEPTFVSTEPKKSYIYPSVDALARQAKYASINIYGSDGKSTRCLGAANDANLSCEYEKDGQVVKGFDWRKTLYPAFKGSKTQVGDNDYTIDSWNVLDVARNTPDVAILYDRERDGELNEEILNNLPMHALIGTGDARGRFVSKNNPSRVSRHTITNLGFTTEGKPIIYDLGKFSAGIPEQYKGEINFIVAPAKNQVKFFADKTAEKTSIEPAPALIAKDIPTEQKEPLLTFNSTDFTDQYLALFKKIFSGRRA